MWGGQAVQYDVGRQYIVLLRQHKWMGSRTGCCGLQDWVVLGATVRGWQAVLRWIWVQYSTVVQAVKYACTGGAAPTVDLRRWGHMLTQAAAAQDMAAHVVSHISTVMHGVFNALYTILSAPLPPSSPPTPPPHPHLPTPACPPPPSACVGVDNIRVWEETTLAAANKLEEERRKYDEQV